MAATKTVPKPAAAQAAPLPTQPENMMQELKVTGHLMALPTGIFSFLNEPNPLASQTNGLPGVRISPPPSGGGNIEITSFRPDGWLSAEGDAALVKIRKGPAQVLVTIYQLANMPDAAPRLQVHQLVGGAPTPAAQKAEPEQMDLLAHIQTRGDVGAKFGDWLGESGSKAWIEGFAITAPEGIEPADLSYQAVLGRGWLSPWVESGEYCGSRGMALPLLGLRVRLTGEAADHYDVGVSARFVGGTSAGPVGNDETCEGDTLAPLESFQVTLTPRTSRKTAKKR